MKTKLILLFSIGCILLSCKQETKTENQKDTETETAAEAKTTLQLSNYSDDNWANGVGIAYNMLLTDFSKEKEEMLKKGKELEFKDGTIVPYTGYEVKGDFINIMLAENPAAYKAVAQYPNQVIIR